MTKKGVLYAHLRLKYMKFHRRRPRVIELDLTNLSSKSKNKSNLVNTRLTKTSQKQDIGDFSELTTPPEAIEAKKIHKNVFNDIQYQHDPFPIENEVVTRKNKNLHVRFSEDVDENSPIKYIPKNKFSKNVLLSNKNREKYVEEVIEENNNISDDENINFEEDINYTENFNENIENEVEFNENDLSNELNNLEIEEEPKEVGRDSFSSLEIPLSPNYRDNLDSNEKEDQEISFQPNDIQFSKDTGFINFDVTTSPIESYENIYTPKRKSKKYNNDITSLELSPLSPINSIENIYSNTPKDLSFEYNNQNNDFVLPSDNISTTNSIENTYLNTKIHKRRSTGSSGSSFSSVELNPPLPNESVEITKKVKRCNDIKLSNGLSPTAERTENKVSPNRNKTADISFQSNDSQSNKNTRLPPCDVSPIHTVSIDISQSTTPPVEKKKSKKKKSIESRKNTSFEIEENIISDDSNYSPISLKSNNDSSITSLPDNYYSDVPICSIENYCDSLEDYAVYPNTSFKTPEKIKKIPQCCIEKFAEELQ